MNRTQQLVAWARTSPTARIILCLTCIWMSLLAVFGLGGVFGAPVGLNIHPTGEDRVWTDLLDMPGFRTHRSWWAIASRNPLAPWWYEATGVLTALTPSGLFLAKKIVELIMALAASLLLFEILDRKRLGVSLGLGALILTWNFSGYVEQILFVMHIGLGVSLLAAYCYLRFIKTQRKTYQWLLAGLAAYFVALGTYTIQCGTPLAILALGLAFVDKTEPDPKRAARAATFWDVTYFLFVFVLYSMVWITTSGSTSSYFKLNAKLFLSNAWTSIVNLVWHQDTTDLVRTLRDHWSSSFLLITFGLSFCLSMAIMKWISRREPADSDNHSTIASRVSPALLLAIIAASIAIPTFAIEAMSTTWYPGSRSRMIQQVFQPLFYLVIVLAFAQVLLRTSFARQRFAYLSLSALFALGTVFAFEHNRKLLDLSHFEDQLVSHLKELANTEDQPSHFVVRIDAPDWYGGRNNELNRILMRQSFQSDLVSLDAVFPGVADPAQSVRLESEESGVYLPSIKRTVPYQDIRFGSFDGKQFTLLDPLREYPFEKFQVVDQRDVRAERPRLVAVSGARGNFHFEFDQQVPGRGWSVPEVSAVGESFVWMSASTATVEFEQPSNTALRLQFRLLQPAAVEARDSLECALRDEPLAMRVIDKTDNKWTYEATIPSTDQDQLTSLSFKVRKQTIPMISGRKLAIPFDWIDIQSIPQ
jgi:hypothetical protein